MFGKHCGGRIHALPRQNQQQPEHLDTVAFKLFGRCNRLIAADAALPDRVGGLGLAMRLLRDSEVGKEQKVDERVDELFGQRSRLHPLVRGSGPRMLLFIFIEEHFVRYGGFSCSLASFAPEESLLPFL